MLEFVLEIGMSVRNLGGNGVVEIEIERVRNHVRNRVINRVLEIECQKLYTGSCARKRVLEPEAVLEILLEISGRKLEIILEIVLGIEC